MLFDSANPDLVMRRIWDDNLTLGVCAKTLKTGDVAWKCEDCEKDPTCIICKDCFEKGNHEGHRVWLKTDVSGCCDCGDPEAWDEKGCCPDHKGIDSSKDKALAQLPKLVRSQAPIVFKALTKILKRALLDLLQLKSESLDEKRVHVQMISEFFRETSLLLERFKQSIFFLSSAYSEIFYGQFPLEEDSPHSCCHRYFVSEDHQAKFEEEKALFDSQQIDNVQISDKSYCTCSVIDLLMQADQLYASADHKLSGTISKHCIAMFQAYEFKEQLCFSYIANIASISRHGGQTRGMAELGVHILSMTSVTSRIVKDSELCKAITNNLHSIMHDFVAGPSLAK